MALLSRSTGLLCIVLLHIGIAVQSHDCTFYKEGPIYIALKKHLGWVHSGDIFEISFDIMGLDNYCTSTFCYVFGIGVDCPNIFITTDPLNKAAALVMEMLYNETLYQYIVHSPQQPMHSIFQDSQWHHFNFQSLSFADHGYKSAIIKIDNNTYDFTKIQYTTFTRDNITWSNPNIVIDNSSLWMNPDASCLISGNRIFPWPYQFLANVTIRNLCINIGPKPDPIQPFMEPSYFPSMDSVDTSPPSSVMTPSSKFASDSESESSEDSRNNDLSQAQLIAIAVGMSIFIIFCCIVIGMIMFWKWHFPNYTNGSELAKKEQNKEYTRVNTKEKAHTVSKVKQVKLVTDNKKKGYSRVDTRYTMEIMPEITEEQLISSQINDSLYQIYLQSPTRCIAKCEEMGLSHELTDSLFAAFARRKENPLLDD